MFTQIVSPQSVRAVRWPSTSHRGHSGRHLGGNNAGLGHLCYDLLASRWIQTLAGRCQSCQKEQLLPMNGEGLLTYSGQPQTSLHSPETRSRKAVVCKCHTGRPKHRTWGQGSERRESGPAAASQARRIDKEGALECPESVDDGSNL